MTGGRSVLRIEGFKHSNLKTGAPNEREAHQPAAPTHARRHEHAPVRARYATRVYPRKSNSPSGTLQIRVFSSFTVSFNLPMISRSRCNASSAVLFRHRITRSSA